MKLLSSSIFILCLLGVLTLAGCGKKAGLYSPTEDRSATQSDQSFVFPPQRDNKIDADDSIQQQDLSK